MMTSLGIDLSTKATGLVLLEEVPGAQPKVLIEAEVISPKKGWAQKSEIARCVMEVVLSRMPDKIVLEGYSLNLQHASSVVPLVELGGLLRFMLFIDGFKWFDPRASEVKKFVTGKGNSPKDQVMMHVLKRWGHTSKSNNTADAFVCAAMGLAHANRLAGVTVDMRAIVGKLGLTTA